MRTTRFAFTAVALFVTFAAATLWPADALAQRRGHGRTVVVVGVGGFGYPRYVFYDPWFDPWYGPYWYQYPRPYPPYPYREYDDRTASLRLDVKPRQAEVFVDGYAAGVVDDFDGVFQRLHVRPGEHELVLFLDGYRTVRQQLYLNRYSSQKVTVTMDRLGPGETTGPRPVPAPRTEAQEEPRRGDPAPTQNFGTLSIRVLPADAEILVDGERWMTATGQDRLVLQLADGRHRVEVRKDGFEKFTTEIEVRRGETTTLNVSLLRAHDSP